MEGKEDPVRVVDCSCVPRCLCVNENHHDTHQCFMFRSRRNNLVKRLWKCRQKIENEGTCTTETPEELEIKSVIHCMLKRLKERQLEVLVQSVESKGGERTDCVLLPNSDLRCGRRSLTSHVLCCQIWRWPDLNQEYELRRLSCCSSADDPTYICCNPFHWSRLVVPGKIAHLFDTPSHVATPPTTTSRSMEAAIFVVFNDWVPAHRGLIQQ